MVDQVETLMLYEVTRLEISKTTKLPPRTVDDYMRRVRERWAAESEPTRVESKKLQVRRIMRQIQDLSAIKKYDEVEKRERLIARIKGHDIHRVEVTGAGGEPVRVTYQNVRERLGALAKTLTDVPGDAPTDGE